MIYNNSFITGRLAAGREFTGAMPASQSHPIYRTLLEIGLSGPGINGTLRSPYRSLLHCCAGKSQIINELAELVPERKITSPGVTQ